LLHAQPDIPTIAAVAAKWISFHVAISRSPKNVMMAVQRIDRFLNPFMGSRPIADVRPMDLRQYRVWLESRELAPRTVKHLLGDVRCMLNWAEAEELVERSPFPRRIMPRIQQLPPDRLSDAEVVRILTVPEPHARIIRLGLGTGLRWGELCRIQPHDVQGGMLTVSQTKSGKIRRVPLNPALRLEIADCSGRPVPYGVGSAGSFNNFVRRHTGVARFHVHQLRHTFACRWIEGGGSLLSLQQILGHASVITTQGYARLSDEYVRREHERITGNGDAPTNGTSPHR